MAMKFVTIRELKINGSKVIDGLNGEDAIITKRGKPVAALVPLDEDTIEEFIMTHNPKFLAELSRAHKEYQKKGGKDLDTVRKELKKRRRG
jgi:prevent-host-death family protein